MATREEFDRANERAARQQAAVPTAVSARYDQAGDRVIIELSSGLEVAFSPRDAQGLELAEPGQLSSIEISPSGFGLHFPKLDADLYLPAVLEGFLGSARWMASRLGARGGRARSKVKAAASRENGKLGGRPPKKTRLMRRRRRTRVRKSASRRRKTA